MDLQKHVNWQNIKEYSGQKNLQFANDSVHSTSFIVINKKIMTAC